MRLLHRIAYNKFGLALRRYCFDNGLSLKDFAILAGITETTLINASKLGNAPTKRTMIKVRLVAGDNFLDSTVTILTDKQIIELAKHELAKQLGVDIKDINITVN